MSVEPVPWQESHAFCRPIKKCRFGRMSPHVVVFSIDDARTGFYGMNFKCMPELEWPWGYPLVLFVMLAVGVSMVIYFRRKKWL